MAVNIAQMAQQAAQQGQQMLNEDNANAANYTNQYNQYQQQADAANRNVQSYTQGMQGDYNAATGNGNAGSAYNYGLNQQLGKLGYSQDAMTQASNNLNQSNGALSAYSDFANTAASKWGLNAGGFAAANSGALGSLNNNIASNQGQVSQLMDKYKTGQTGANQFAGVTIQGEHETLAGLQNVYTNASSARDSAAQQMEFYRSLASSQGNLNSQEQQAYGAAQAAYAQASAAMAQASLYSSQAALANQQYQHQASLYNTSSPAQQLSNNEYAAMNNPAAHAQASANNGLSLGSILSGVGHKIFGNLHL